MAIEPDCGIYTAEKNLLIHLTSKGELDSKLEKALKLFISEELRKSLKACFYKRKKLSGKSLFEELNKVKAWRQVTGISGQFPVLNDQTGKLIDR